MQRDGRDDGEDERRPRHKNNIVSHSSTIDDDGKKECVLMLFMLIKLRGQMHFNGKE